MAGLAHFTRSRFKLFGEKGTFLLVNGEYDIRHVTIVSQPSTSKVQVKSPNAPTQKALVAKESPSYP